MSVQSSDPNMRLGEWRDPKITADAFRVAYAISHFLSSRTRTARPGNLMPSGARRGPTSQGPAAAGDRSVPRPSQAHVGARTLGVIAARLRLRRLGGRNPEGAGVFRLNSLSHRDKHHDPWSPIATAQ